MTTAIPFTAWQEPPLSGDPAAAIRLAALGTTVALYQPAVRAASTTEFAGTGCGFVTELTPIQGQNGVLGGGTKVAIPQPLGRMPAFDIAGRDDGSLAVAIEFFGGAFNALRLGTVGRSGFAETALYQDFTDYRWPRFLRGEAKPGQLVAAIAGNALVALDGNPLARKDLGAKPAPFTKLAEAAAGVAIATAPPNGQQSLALFIKNPGVGPQLPSGDFVGTLTLTAVVRGQPAGKPQTLFDPNGLYTFDVDAHGSLALILGSTKTGPRLLACDLSSGKTGEIAWPQGYPASDTWIANPSVLAVPGGNVFALAFFDFSANGPKGIRYAELELAAVP